MSDTVAAEALPGDPAQSPLGKMLGLKEDEVAALGTLFTDVTRSLGIDGAPIFDGLRQGKSLGQAMALPRGLGELLYARAHRWFSFGRIDKAEPLFRALCVLESGTADHWVGYGVCLRSRGDMEPAKTAFETAAKLRSDWAVPHFHALELAVNELNWAEAESRLAAYDQRAGGDIPAEIKVEVERLRTAVSLRAAPERRDATP